MTNKPVKTQELKKVLHELGSSFMSWDEERRKKVDIVLWALQANKETVDLELTLQHIDWLVEEGKDFQDLAPAAKKMLRIHYLDLSRSDEKRAEDLARMKRASAKLEGFEKKML